MQKLVVLDLSMNRNFNELPDQVSYLTSLKYLDLSYTSIEKLPIGFHELKKLTHLDFTYTMKLCSVGKISKLSSLRTLKLLKSKACGDVILLEEMQLLEYLQVITMTISTDLGLEKILADQRLATCINGLEILRFEGKPFEISLLLSMENLRELRVDSIHVSEINTNLKFRESPCFTNLKSVAVSNCNSIKDLTWLLLFPNLGMLIIENSEEVEEIINKEKATNLAGITPFQKLKILRMRNLPKLESIYWCPLPFPLLRFIHAIQCPKLRKLPFDATSAPRLGEISITMRPGEQITDLEWEDEDTKNRFLPSFRRV
jgi:disease resistance protein RPS2